MIHIFSARGRVTGALTARKLKGIGLLDNRSQLAKKAEPKDSINDLRYLTTTALWNAVDKCQRK
jgi:hypothetical protein